MVKPNFVVDADSFRILQGEVEIGRISELSPSEAGLVAPHIQEHSDTFFIATSGVELSGSLGGFKKGDDVVLIEWVRLETKPLPKEPELNVYRYVFGRKDERCVGYDVTRPYAGSSTGQLLDHWATLDQLFERLP